MSRASVASSTPRASAPLQLSEPASQRLPLSGPASVSRSAGQPNRMSVSPLPGSGRAARPSARRDTSARRAKHSGRSRASARRTGPPNGQASQLRSARRTGRPASPGHPPRRPGRPASSGQPWRLREGATAYRGTGITRSRPRGASRPHLRPQAHGRRPMRGPGRAPVYSQRPGGGEGELGHRHDVIVRIRQSAPVPAHGLQAVALDGEDAGTGRLTVREADIQAGRYATRERPRR